MTSEDLSGRTSRGAVWTLLGNLLVKGLSIVVILIVARVLDADAYGQAVLALAFFGFAEVITNPALQTTLLREPDLKDDMIDVAWTLSVLRGALMTVVFFTAAPWLAQWWPDQQAVMTGYLRILSFTFAITGLLNLHVIRLRRELRFGTAFLVESASPFLGTLFVIATLLAYGEAMWIVSGPLVGAVAGTIVSMLFVRPFPRVRLAREDVGRLWRFSRPLMLSAIMIFVLLNGDSLFVESVAGFAALGIYALSLRWSNVGVNFAVHGLHNVLMPAYVKMRGDPDRLRHAVISALSILTAVCALISSLFMAFADEFFRFIGNGADWSGAATVARALVPFVLARGINACLAPIFLVCDKPHWLTAMTAVQLVAFVPAMWIGHQWLGLPGIALAVASLSLGVCFAQMHWSRKLIGLSPAAFVQAIAPALLTAGAGALIGWLCVRGNPDPTVRLFLGSCLTVLSFVALWEGFCRQPRSRKRPQRSFLELAGMLSR